MQSRDFLMPSKKISSDERARRAAARDPRQMPLPLPGDYKAGLIFPTPYVKTLEERIESLPKWAQKLIADLQADLKDAKLNSHP